MRERKCGEPLKTGRNRCVLCLHGLLCGFFAWGLIGCSAIPNVQGTGDRVTQLRTYRDAAVQLRGLPLTREVAVEKESPDALKSALATDLDKPENRAFLSDTELLLKQFRVLKSGDSLRDLYLLLMSQQVAAYYDPEKKRVAYVDENVGAAKKEAQTVPGMERFVYVHEFCHAVEDAHFDLDRLTKASLVELDRNLAMTSLVEGDAVLVGMDSLCEEYPLNTATPFGAALVRLLGGADMKDAAKEMEGCPPFLGGSLIRPYLDGAAFCNRIRRDEGWQGLDSVYRSRIPLTTAEILYPERRYLKAFKPAIFNPDASLFTAAEQVCATNSLGVLGMALWLDEKGFGSARQLPFLKGWMGDRIYLVRTGETGAVQTVWLSYWERTGLARAFQKHVGERLHDGFKGLPVSVRREGRLVAAVWSTDSACPQAACDGRAVNALKSRVEVAAPSYLDSCWADLPLPLRFPAYEGHSAGCEILGGCVADVKGGAHFFRFNLASGLLLNVENTPDRHHVSTCWGLLRHVGDARSDFTYWQVPVVAKWFRRGSGDAERYQWSLLWGLLADGTEKRARVLFIPVWHNSRTQPAHAQLSSNVAPCEAK